MGKQKLIEVYAGQGGKPNNYKKLADETYRRYDNHRQMGQVMNEILSDYFKKKSRKSSLRKKKT